MGLIIIGASGHGKVTADIAVQRGYREIFFLDDDASVKNCMGFPVIGRTSDAADYSGFDFFVAIGNSGIREKIQEGLVGMGYPVVTLIHPRATVAESVTVGIGTVIMAGAVVNPDAGIGSGCIINTGATVDHDSLIADYCHAAVGCHLAGGVRVGRGSWIGAGAVVSNNITIGENVMIGAGAVVIRDIPDGSTAVGVPAKVIKCNQR